MKWPFLTVIGITAATVVIEWLRSRREDRRQTGDLERNQAHREGYKAGYLAGLNGATEFRARDINNYLGAEVLYGFGQCCRGCHRACSVVISKRSEYWRCSACGVVNASPLPTETATTEG